MGFEDDLRRVEEHVAEACRTAVRRTNSPGLLIRSSVSERRSLIIVHGFYLGFGSSSLPWSVCRLAAATAENQNVVNLNEWKDCRHEPLVVGALDGVRAWIDEAE